MDLIKFDIKDLSAIKCEFHKTTMPSFHHLEVLVVKFIGECGHGSNNNEDAIYMSAMIAAGFIACCYPQGLILDLSELKYEWGDMMSEVVWPPYNLISVSDKEIIYPFAVVISDLNRTGLTSLVKEEMMEKPNEYLFETFNEALNKVNEMANQRYK